MIITILRKPLEGSVAENTLKYGCGAINIDATRVDTSDNLNGGAYAENPTERHDGKENWRFERGKGEYKQPSGRWPANFILTHLEGCELRGTKKIKSQSTQGHGEINPYDSERTMNDSSTKDNGRNRWFSDADGKEEVLDWACAEGCPVQELDRQSGHLKSSTRTPTGKPIYPTSNTSVTWNPNNVMDTTTRGFGDEGGASRFFKQFKKEDDR